ncbi:hypothetical protein D3C81_1456690 [compost metagenome]
MTRLIMAMKKAAISHSGDFNARPMATKGIMAIRPKAGPASDTSTPCHSLLGSRCALAMPPRKGMM